MNVVLNLRAELEKFQKRHVNYLDSLSNFMQSLDLEGAQTAINSLDTDIDFFSDQRFDLGVISNRLKFAHSNVYSST